MESTKSTITKVFLMREFEIYSYEINTKQTVKAQGIAEAMLDYLPMPTLDIQIKWQPNSGDILVTDNQTEFRYKVTPL